MLTYYVIYRDDAKVRPAGIFVMDPVTEAAILWNHRQGAWTYDPSLVVRFLDDYRNLDRYENVDRSTVEGLVQEITGGASLPDDDSIMSMLQKGIQLAE
ncbi:hypothetical protein [Micromonospora peucetia]|uniref:Uncharacterized protein n=1 Tax=Micromonospora peucetia TaxID=47871 RepID=A0A1C6UE03_9ACTN|nr:hypothetical protein [Micromonospora peucetia]WSA33900.1 hypothetical protein OIE14_07595 [Micromonospora peucetia]SCL52204.1 hypothetical protein GA0070608_0979 [Micromonospora peucetia]